MHVWSEPRFEDSVDKNRGKEINQQYCTLCFQAKKSSDEIKPKTLRTSS